MRHVRQLDGLRALAVAGVLFHHFVLGKLELGTFGVLLFFVISGFLITGILLDTKSLVSSGLLSIREALRLFYMRRVLRIFPLYYFVLAALFVLDVPAVRERMLWNASYLTNIWIAVHHHYDEATGHFWSLAVEEQFYICWPLIILLTPRRYLRPLMYTLICASASFRAFGKLLFQLDPVTSNALTIAQLDPLAIGGLLALKNESDKRLIRSIGVYCAPAVVVEVALGLLGVGTKLRWVSFELLCTLSAASLVSRAASGIGTGFGRFLEWRPVRYVGSISYGLYIYHLPVFILIGKRGWLAALLTLVVASVSWRFFEKPINDLKRYFEYPRQQARAPSVAAPAAVQRLARREAS
jgi:peptidoglycan/LPS O-acetylase OafA/YrhL